MQIARGRQQICACAAAALGIRVIDLVVLAPLIAQLVLQHSSLGAQLQMLVGEVDDSLLLIGDLAGLAVHAQLRRRLDEQLSMGHHGDVSGNLCSLVQSLFLFRFVLLIGQALHELRHFVPVPE